MFSFLREVPMVLWVVLIAGSALVLVLDYLQ